MASVVLSVAVAALARRLADREVVDTDEETLAERPMETPVGA